MAARNAMAAGLKGRIGLSANNSTLKLCIVSSCGGHLTEARALKPVYENYQHFYVLNDLAILPKDMSEKTYFIRHSERDWLFFVNLWEALRILWKERPDAILSTGAGPAVPFAIVGRFLFRTRIIFIETFTRCHSASLTGRIMYHLAHRFYYQWESLRDAYPDGIYGGPLV